MSESTEITRDISEPSKSVTAKLENPFRDVQYGRIYDHLESGRAINIAALGDISVEIDEENLGLERISPENLQKGWKRDKKSFIVHCADLGIDIEPFEVYKFFQIQKKVFQVLGKPIQNEVIRTKKLDEKGYRVKLSETKGIAMCSEYAILATYIAQKIGEPVHLIIGSVVETEDEDKWRESHAYVWLDRLNAVFDCVLASNEKEYPAIMKPVQPATLGTLETGKDIEARRIGSNFVRYYGMQAGGFGVEMDVI